MQLNGLGRSILRVLAAAVLLIAWPVLAQQPPVRILVGYPPGGSTDIIARSLAEGLTTLLGRPVVVENRPGAGGQIAANVLKAAPPDGTTLFLTNSHTVSMIPLTVLNPGFDALKDFAPVGLVALSPDFLVLSQEVKLGSKGGLGEFARWAKENPGRGNVGVPAPASLPAFAVGMIAEAFKTDLSAVPYRGDAPIMQDLAGGQIAAGIASVGVVIPFLKSGKVQVAAVNGTKRLALFPEVPTYAEQGVKGYEEVMFTGMFAPAGTPRDTISKYSAAIAKAMRSPAFADKLSALGVIALYEGPAELEARLKATNKAFEKVVKDAGFKPM